MKNKLYKLNNEFFYKVDINERDFTYIYNFNTNKFKFLSQLDLDDNYELISSKDKSVLILLEGIETPDKTLIFSYHKADYKIHIDKNQEIYLLEGTNDYINTNFNIVKPKKFQITNKSSIFLKRNYLTIKENNKFIKICNISNLKILKIILENKLRYELILVLKEEYLYRLLNGINLKNNLDK